MEYTQEQVLDQLDSGQSLELLFHDHSQEVVDLLQVVTEKLFDRLRKNELADNIYRCIQTLLTHAIQMNTKRLFFERHDLDMNNMAQYISGMNRFESILKSAEYDLLVQELKQKDFWVKFSAAYSDDGVKIEIQNNTEIAEIEEKQLRLLLRKYMHYDHYSEVYQDTNTIDYSEHLGLAAIVLLLKQANLDASLFRIGSKEGHTLSRIEVGLTDQYQTVRQRSTEISE